MLLNKRLKMPRMRQMTFTLQEFSGGGGEMPPKTYLSAVTQYAQFTQYELL